MKNSLLFRSSNESRQSLLYKLHASARRQLGKKVLDAGREQYIVNIPENL